MLKNLKALTGKVSLRSASGVLEPVERIEVSKRSPLLACELCGTRFGVGAWMTRPPKVKRIAVGGTCLDSLVLGRFGDRASALKGRKEVRRALERAYRGAIDPGSWIKWVVANAPRKFGRAVIELEVAGALRKKDDLQELIRFHDGTRKFPSEAFFLRNLVDVRRGIDVPAVLTIDQALAIRDRVSAEEARIAEGAVGRIGRRHIKDFLQESGPEVQRTWDRLTNPGRATVTALVALHEGPRGESEPFCPASLASRWPSAPHPVTDEAFLWHPAMGLAHIDPFADDVQSKVWLWSSGYAKHRINLLDWRDVNGASMESIAGLRRLAASRLARDSRTDQGSLAGLLRR